MLRRKGRQKVTIDIKLYLPLVGTFDVITVKLKSRNYGSKINQKQITFYYFSLILLLIVVFAFGTYAVLKMHHLNSPSPVIAVHAVSMFLWYSLLFYQARLIGLSNIKVHQQLGMTSVVLAISIIISGIIIGVTDYKGEKDPFEILAIFAFIIAFGVLYSLAIKYGFKKDIHKRLVLLASIAMLPPALSRILRIFSIDDTIFGGPFWLLSLMVLPIYDYRKMKKIHRTTILSTVFLMITMFMTLPIGTSNTWINLVKSIIGN